MEVEAIRDAFPKGSVMINHSGIFIYYTSRSGWVTESIDKQTLMGLIGSADAFGIDYSSRKFTRLIFRREIDNQEIVFYQPRTREITLDDLREILENEHNPPRDFVDFFEDVDLRDEDALRERLSEWFKFSRDFENANDAASERLDRIFNLCSRVFGFCEIEADEPDSEYDGSVEIRFPENVKRIMWYSGNLKDSLLEILGNSSEVSIETNVQDGYFSMFFYA